jgi:Tol biopolymer transport system component
MPGTAGGDRPFFSPDGNWVGYFSSKDGKLKKIAISGGVPASLAKVDPSGSFSWGAGDAIVYGTILKGIMRVSADGGKPEQIIKAAEKEDPAETQQLVHPQILPDGKSILFTRAWPQPVKLMLQSLKTGERRELFEGNSGKYLPTGHIVFEYEGSLSAIRFDVGTLKPSGGAVPVVQTVWTVGGTPQYAVSGLGALIYLPGSMDAARSRTLVWVSRDGKEEPAATESNQYLGARISPDGTKAALHFSTDENLDVWVLDVNHKTMSRLTLDPAVDILPVWTKDGRRIAFFSYRDGSPKVYIKMADGTGKDEVLSSAPGAPASWSKDGKILVLQSRSGKSGWDIDAVSMEGDRKSRPLLNGKYNETQPQVSPDGRWIAYTSDESGQLQIYVRTFPDVDSGGRWQISRNGGDSALWSPDGRELFYHTGNAVMAVSVKTDPAFTHDTPEMLFQRTYAFPAPSALASQRGGTFCPWDIHPDGKRFLMIKRPGTVSGEEGPRKINVVLNWLEELKQKVPPK